MPGLGLSAPIGIEHAGHRNRKLDGVAPVYSFAMMTFIALVTNRSASSRTACGGAVVR